MYYEIKTDRLLLRPLDIKDLDSVFIYASDEDNTTFMLMLPEDTKEEAARYLIKVTAEWEKENPVFYEFAVTLDREQIGAVSVKLNIEKNTGELGWIINKRYWKKGYAMEAAIAVRDFAVKELKLSKLIATCDFRNSNSYHLMEKIGFTLESDIGIRTYPKSGETAKELTYAMSVC